jgi:signal transduction histidine kinase
MIQYLFDSIRFSCIYGRRCMMYVAAIYALFFIAVEGRAQTGAAYEVRYIGLKEGLQSNAVLGICQSHEGRLWIGTANGLFLYNGIDMERLGTNTGSSIPLPGNHIIGIEEDARQRLWVLTGAGLVFIDPARGRLLSGREMGLPDSIFKEKVLSIDAGKPGEIMLQAGWNMYKYTDGQLRLWSALPHQLNKNSTIFYDQKEEGVYVSANGNEFYLVNKNGVQPRDGYLKENGRTLTAPLSKSQFRLLHLPGISDSLLLYLIPGTILKREYEGGEIFYKPLGNNALAKLFPPWQAVLDFISAPGSPLTVDPPNLYLFDVIHSKSGLWMLGTNYGVFLVQAQRKPFKHLPGTERRPIRGMIQHKSGRLLIASKLELIDYDLRNKTGRFFPNFPNIWNFVPLGKDCFLSCVETHDGLNELCFSASNRITSNTPSYSNQLGFTRSMVQTPQGIWTGNISSHLFFLPSGNNQAPEAAPYNNTQTPGKFANAILYSARSGLWVGSVDGLYRYSLDPHTDRMTANRSAELPQALKAASINALYESAEGKIWIGCGQNQGLYAYEPGSRTLQHWDISNGLSDNTVYSILGSNSDSLLWFGTQSGLSRMNVAAQSFRNFYADDGLEQTEFNTAARYKSPDGTLYFGGMNGVSYFRPEWVPEVSAPINAYLHLNVFDLKTQKRRQLSPQNDETVVFAPNEQYIQIDIRSNELFQAAAIKGRYKIEGIGNTWQTANILEKITLAGLPSGTYKLTVQVQVPNESWSAPFVLSMVVSPFWYETWWFRSFIVLAVALILYVAYQMRIRQIRKDYEMRKQISDDLHDDLGSRIFAMKALASKISNPKLSDQERSEVSEQFENLSKNVMTRVRDFIWTFDPQHDQLTDFVDRLEDFTFVAVRPVVRDLKFEQDVPENFVFASPSRHHLLMIFQEILTNMLKHTRPEKIRIQVSLKAQHFHIRIVNNHLGILTASEDQHGHGIASMNKRAEEQQIKLLWKEEPNIQEAEIIYKIIQHV